MKLVHFLTLPCLIAGLIACGSHSSDKTFPHRLKGDAPLALAVFGDSIASGMFADTALGEPLTNEQAQHFAELYRLSESEDSDSEEFYVDAQRIAANPDASAFSGTAAYALAPRLEKSTGHDVGIFRYAISGSTTATLPTQLDHLDQDNAQGLRQADLAIVNIGANDFCRRVDSDAFAASLKADLERLLVSLPKSKLLIVPLPPVPEVMSLPDAPAFSALGLDVTCSDVRTKMQLCEGRSIAPGASAESIAQDVADLAQLNQKMAEVVAALNETATGMDRIELSAAPQTPTSTELAIDCFHPGVHGHEKIADTVWPALQKLAAP